MRHCMTRDSVKPLSPRAHRSVATLLFLITALAAVLSSNATTLGDEPRPAWIWSRAEHSANEVIRFQREFSAQHAIGSGEIRIGSVTAGLTLQLDDVPLAFIESDDAIKTITLPHQFPAGKHRLTVEARPTTGPSGFFVEARVTLDDNSVVSFVTDDQWTGSNNAAVAVLGDVDSRLLVPRSRRIGIEVTDNYEQWKQSLGDQATQDPATFSLAPGFEISLVRDAAPNEDSWVSMTFDDQGRIIIAKERRGLLRMTRSADGSTIQHVETIDDQLLECRGLMFVGDDLYANANNSKGLYRLRKQGDAFAPAELVHGSTGGVGHGRNDLALGPDGRLYSIHGDDVDLAKDATDMTSPFREARQGKATREGHLLRIDLESGKTQILAAGLRNPFGIDFNERGDVFTYDADAEYDMGSPWYRPTRVNHLVYGSDYGWRGVTQSWPPYYPDHPDTARPGLDIGKGSPTAVKFGARGHFPAPYRDALYVLDWSYGRILAIHMLPRGSSYLMTGETFLKGRPFNATDLDFSPEGDMYVITGGRQTQSALYRIRYVADPWKQHNVPRHVDPSSFESQLRQHADRSREMRLELEQALTMPPALGRINLAWTHLSNDDAAIRYAAMKVLEHHPIDMWAARALEESHGSRATAALLALARSPRNELAPQIIQRLNHLVNQLVTNRDKEAAYYAYLLCFAHMDKSGELQTETAECLRNHYPSEAGPGASYRQNRLLSELMIQLAAPDAVSTTLELLRQATNQTEHMHYLHALRLAETGWTVERRREYFASLNQAKHYVGGAGMNAFISQIREDAASTLDDQTRTELADLLNPTDEPAEFVAASSRPLINDWTVEQLLSSDQSAASRNLDRGAQVFASAQCVHCHRFGSRGTLIGPDLTAVSRRFGTRDILTSIIEPSRVVAENYRSLQVVTVDGKTFVGQATLGGDFRSPTLRLATNPSRPFETVEIPKGDIESETRSEVSWMPEGLLDTFTREEILDLVYYLSTGP